jgi:hypothetical protein
MPGQASAGGAEQPQLLGGRVVVPLLVRGVFAGAGMVEDSRVDVGVLADEQASASRASPPPARQQTRWWRRQRPALRCRGGVASGTSATCEQRPAAGVTAAASLAAVHTAPGTCCCCRRRRSGGALQLALQRESPRLVLRTSAAARAHTRQPGCRRGGACRGKPCNACSENGYHYAPPPQHLPGRRRRGAWRVAGRVPGAWCVRDACFCWNIRPTSCPCLLVLLIPCLSEISTAAHPQENPVHAASRRHVFPSPTSTANISHRSPQPQPTIVRSAVLRLAGEREEGPHRKGY